METEKQFSVPYAVVFVLVEWLNEQQKIYDTVGAVLIFTRKIVERGKIDISKTNTLYEVRGHGSFC
jgi:hypothetical protein